MTQLPALYFAELFDSTPAGAADGIEPGALAELLDALDKAGVRSPAVPALLGADLLLDDLDPGALMILADCRLEAIAHWARALHAYGFASLVGCACATAESSGFLQAADAPILLGHGIILASRGVTGRPLVGLSLAELRRELRESRARLSAVAGYPVRILMPALSTFGQAVDGLVLSEARRAGYKLALEPGGRVTDLDAPANPGRLHTLDYRIVSSDDAPQRLADWVVGQGLSRQTARVGELLRRPRRILSRLRLS